MSFIKKPLRKTNDFYKIWKLIRKINEHNMKTTMIYQK